MWWGGGGSEEDDGIIEAGNSSPPLEILAEDEEIESGMNNLSPRSTGSSPAMTVPRPRPESRG